MLIGEQLKRYYLNCLWDLKLLFTVMGLFGLQVGSCASALQVGFSGDGVRVQARSYGVWCCRSVLF